MALTNYRESTVAPMVSRVVRKWVFGAVVDLTFIKAQQWEIWLVFVRQQRRAECFRLRTYTRSRRLGDERILSARERRMSSIESEERVGAWTRIGESPGVMAPTAYYY